MQITKPAATAAARKRFLLTLPHSHALLPPHPTPQQQHTHRDTGARALPPSRKRAAHTHVKSKSPPACEQEEAEAEARADTTRPTDRPTDRRPRGKGLGVPSRPERRQRYLQKRGLLLLTLPPGGGEKDEGFVPRETPLVWPRGQKIHPHKTGANGPDPHGGGKERIRGAKGKKKWPERGDLAGLGADFSANWAGIINPHGSGALLGSPLTHCLPHSLAGWLACLPACLLACLPALSSPHPPHP